MKNFYHQLVRILLVAFSLVSFQTFAQVSGTVFKDFNANGTKDASASYNEVGIAGVTVSATNPAGTALTVTYTGGGTSTNSTGGYAVSGGTLGQIRLEFVLPDTYTYATTGAVGGTTIMFPTTATQNLAVNYAQDYSQTNPRIAVPCYINGDSQVAGTAAAGDAIVSFNYDKSNKTVIGLMGQVGAVWGTAYHRQSDKLFYAALAKRHVSWGPLGPNGIYVTTSAKTATGTTNTGSFVNLKAINPAFDAGSPVRDFTPGGGDKSQGNLDANMVMGAGTTGLGDLDVSDDGQYLYTVNLNDRKVWRIDVGIAGTAPTSASQIVAYTSLPNSCTNSTFRPWALEYYKGEIYVGGVCDGVTDLTNTSSAVNRNNLKATIYKTNATTAPGSATWTQVFTMPLTFNRNANLNKAGLAPASTSYKDPNGTNAALSISSWHPWVRNWNDLTLNVSDQNPYYPQPVLTDIEFDVDGSMILGFGDREGQQVGNQNLTGSNNTGEYGTAVGDILRVFNNNGTFVLENNGTAGSVTTGGAGNTQGPGGGEYYFQDRFDAFQTATPLYVNCIDCNHDETSVGGLGLWAGSGEVLNSVFDPATNWDSGGVRWYSNNDGTAQDGLLLYAATDVSAFGKATGIGDVELLASPAPIEIGNRVWDDTDKDGIQDAGEAGISGVTVTLYAANGTTVIATATTDANGNYYFSSAIGTNTTSAKYGLNLAFNANYILSFPTTVSSKTITTINAGSDDLIDSDANVSTGQISFTTGDAGENNHSFDVGYVTCTPPTATAAATQPTCTGTNTPNNGGITITGFTTGQRYQYSAGATFSSGSAIPASITVIPTGGVITSTLTNTTGSYTVRVYDATDNTCFVDRTISITAVVCCTTPNAGADVTICLPKTTLNLADALSGTQWLAAAGNPATATINATTGEITGLTAVGTYTFSLQTIADATCKDDMQVIVTNGETPIPLCNDGSTSYTLIAPANLTNVIWYNMAGTQVGTGNSFVVTSNINGLADGSEAFYYQGVDGSSSGCDIELCCPVKFIIQNCCPVPNCATVIVIKN